MKWKIFLWSQSMVERNVQLGDDLLSWQNHLLPPHHSGVGVGGWDCETVRGCRSYWYVRLQKQLLRPGRDDFYGMFRQTPIWRRLPKEHVRPHGEGWGLLLYHAQPSSSWLNFFIRRKYDFFLFFLFFQKALPAWCFESSSVTKRNILLLQLCSPHSPNTLHQPHICGWKGPS